MAMYHFRLKSDKKPNGTKISAVKHVEYINREGSFSDDEHEKENDKFVGNFITTEKTPNALGGQNMLLYKTSGLGLIRNTESGLEVTEKASETTIATALLLAAQTMNHQPLIIKVRKSLKEKCLKRRCCKTCLFLLMTCSCKESLCVTSLWIIRSERNWQLRLLIKFWDG